MKPYKHLHARLYNRWSGQLGRITAAVKTSRSTWSITVAFDGDDFAFDWSAPDLHRHNVLVQEDFTMPDFGPVRARGLALLAEAEAEPAFVPCRGGYLTYKRRLPHLLPEQCSDSLTTIIGTPPFPPTVELGLSFWARPRNLPNLRVEAPDRATAFARLAAQVEALPFAE